MKHYLTMNAATTAALLLAGAVFADGRIIITEIMYNPGSNEKKGEAEWVEIANVGDAPVEIVNWKLDDEDKQEWADWGSFSCTLPPGGVAVLVNQAAVTEDMFRDSWDHIDAETIIEEVEENILPGRVDDFAVVSQDPDDETDQEGEPPVEDSVEEPDGDEPTLTEGNDNVTYLVIPIEWGSLANGPDAENEILQLLDENGEVICEVNYQFGGDWPTFYSPGSASLELIDPNAKELNDGKNWRAAEAGVDGARENRQNSVFDGLDVGSPGTVAGLHAPTTAPVAKKADKDETEPQPKGDDKKKPAKDDDNEVDY